MESHLISGVTEGPVHSGSASEGQHVCCCTTLGGHAWIWSFISWEDATLLGMVSCKTMDHGDEAQSFALDVHARHAYVHDMVRPHPNSVDKSTVVNVARGMELILLVVQLWELLKPRAHIESSLVIVFVVAFCTTSIPR